MSRALVGVPPTSLVPLPLPRPFGLLRPDADFVTSSDIRTVTVTGSATPFTKGAWAEVIASAAVDYGGLVLRITGTERAGGKCCFMMDIGTGGAGSEVVRVPNIDLGQHFSGITGRSTGFLSVPFAIPKGTRVAARVATSTASDTGTLHIENALSPLTPFRQTVADAYGINESTGQGVDLPDSGSDHTEGAWAEITAATTRPYRALICVAGVQDVGSQNAGKIQTDFGFGAAGAEVVRVPNLSTETTSSERLYGEQWRTVPIHVPAGTRIAARRMRSGLVYTTASVIGIPY